MSDDLVKRLRYGIVEHRKRWSGDTHADLGGSVDYDATTDMLHEAADRIEELERENQLQAQEIDRTRTRTDKWQGMIIDCERYLKHGETPRQRMDRDHADVLALMKLLAKEKCRAEAAEAKLAKAMEALTPMIVIALDNLDGMDAETREECERDIAKARAALAELGEGDDD